MRNKKFARMSKIVAFALSAAMLTGMVAYAADDTPDAAEPESYCYGDVDLNHEVNADDALLLLQDVVKLNSLPDGLAKILADVNGVDGITADDALLVLQTAVKLCPEKEYVPPVVSEEPSEAPTPTPTPVATPTPTPKPSASVAPKPSTEPTMNPDWVPNAIPTVEPGEPYAGIPAKVLEANGAEVDENGIITFTDANKENGKGVRLENPLAGRTDLRETAEDAVAGQPLLSTLTKEQKTLFDPTAVYPRAKWNKGASISFWVKADWKNHPLRPDAAPLLVVHDSTDVINPDDGTINRKARKNFALMVTTRGAVTFESGDTPENSFRATSVLAGNNHEWNYFTVTIANDWITVYVNGQENVYKSVGLMKDDDGIKYFNDGWLTRYNTIGPATEEDVKNDIRGYLTSGKNPVWRETDGVWSGHVEGSIIGNGRYSNPGAVAMSGDGSELLMNYITGEDTEIWLGGTETKKLITPAQGLGPATYSIASGTQVADLQVYDKELTAAEVAANYEVAQRPDAK